MHNLRFALVVIVLFGVAFGGVSYFGMPRMGLPSSPADGPDAAALPQPLKAETLKVETRPMTAEMKPDAPTPERGVKVAARPAPDTFKETAKPIATDPGGGRSQLALTAISAANAYALAPCNPAAKAAFIIATSTYSRAIAGNDGMAAAAAGSIMDPGVREAMSAAFNAGGVSPDEFPVGTLVPATAKAGSPCGGGRRVENIRR